MKYEGAIFEEKKAENVFSKVLTLMSRINKKTFNS